MRFIAIDVETANAQYSSICTLGYVVFEDGAVVDEKYFLINPKTEFRDINMKIHGIKPEHVANAPTFTEIYAELCAVLENQVVVSHSAFDIQSIGKTLEHHELSVINFHHANSCDVSKIAWPGLRDYKLNTLAKHLGVSINHHNALADARTSGEIFIKAIQTANIPFESFIPVPKSRSRKAVKPKVTPQVPVSPPTTLSVKDRLVGLKSSYIEPYPVQVEGESSYRANLEKIAGYYDEGEGYNSDAHMAILYFEEPDAVRVEIDDLKVGYLSASAAKTLRKKMIELGAPENPIMVCGASVKGGQLINDSFAAQFGVRLDFSLKDLKMDRVRYQNEWLYPVGVKRPADEIPAMTIIQPISTLPPTQPIESEPIKIPVTPQPAKGILGTLKSLFGGK